MHKATTPFADNTFFLAAGLEMCLASLFCGEFLVKIE